MSVLHPVCTPSPSRLPPNPETPLYLILSKRAEDTRKRRGGKGEEWRGWERKRRGGKGEERTGEDSGGQERTGEDRRGDETRPATREKRKEHSTPHQTSKPQNKAHKRTTTQHNTHTAPSGCSRGRAAH
eukprot:1814156-Rhodomonas_salina.1